jgi:hypothetical protein
VSGVAVGSERATDAHSVREGSRREEEVLTFVREGALRGEEVSLREGEVVTFVRERFAVREEEGLTS